ncbi:MAG: hypothetical protein OEU86_09505 [Gammaproteobacteria bacterium]|nr:hypothetical protein [Gammaproteobacteria bacterium]
MFNRLVLLLLLTMPGLLLADANDGEFMGYQLGSNYVRTANTKSTTTTRGNLMIAAEQPVKPADIEEVSVIATVRTQTIGYISAASWFDTQANAKEFAGRYVRLLRAKYPDWAFGDERMDGDLRIVEVNFDKGPYNLRLQLNRDESRASTPWRFSMTLTWGPATEQADNWHALARSQIESAQIDSRERVLQDSDIRGL